MSSKEEIASRLREVGENYGGMAKFAAKLGLSTQGLNPYWTGKSKPGAKLQEKLRALDIDVEYIMSGRKPHATVRQEIGKIIQGPGNKGMTGFVAHKLSINHSNEANENKSVKDYTLILENINLKNTNEALLNTIKDKERIIHELEQRILLLERLANLQK